jgi:hypothetical protein
LLEVLTFVRYLFSIPKTRRMIKRRARAARLSASSLLAYNEVVDAPDRDPAVEHPRCAVHR